MKSILKKIIPEPIKKVRRSLIDQHCMMDGKKNRKSHSVKGVKPLRVVFVVYMPQEWNSLEPVYSLMCNDDRFLVYLVVTPYVSILGDGSKISSYEYFSKYGSNVIDAKTERGWLDINELKPNIIFRQEAFDDNFPDCYSVKKLSRIAHLYYIPYAYTNTKKHIPMEFDIRFVAYCSTIFAANTETYDYLIELKNNNKLLSELNIFDIGFPRYDCLGEVNAECNSYNRFLWIPRYSLDSIGNDATSFFRYQKKLIEYFVSNPEVELRIRPHPFMFREFINKGVMTEQDVEAFIDEVKRIPNISIDNELNYMKSFEWSDVMIADHSSLNFEYYATGKPIIYCSDDVEVSLKERAKCVYDGIDWARLRESMESLRKGIDPIREKRIEGATNENNRMNRQCSKQILDICFDIECIKKVKGKNV